MPCIKLDQYFTCVIKLADKLGHRSESWKKSWKSINKQCPAAFFLLLLECGAFGYVLSHHRSRHHVTLPFERYYVMLKHQLDLTGEFALWSERGRGESVRWQVIIHCFTLVTFQAPPPRLSAPPALLFCRTYYWQTNGEQSGGIKV